MKQTTVTEKMNMRGCERRIYHVLSADSPCFEEAYLILRRRERRQGDVLREQSGGQRGFGGRQEEARTMAEEAERIIRESSLRYLKERRRAPIHRLSPSLAFALGAGTTSLLIGAAALIGVLL